MKQEDVLFFLVAFFIFIIISSLIIKDNKAVDENCLIEKVNKNEENVFNADTSSWNDSCIVHPPF